jgi:hypothetical protein
MQPYGGIGTSHLLNMSLDEITAKLAAGGADWFEQMTGQVKDHAEKRQVELASLAQDIALTFSSPAGENVLKWMIEKTLLNPALPIAWGKSFEETNAWRAAREAENAFVFQIVIALHQHRMANGASA